MNEQLSLFGQDRPRPTLEAVDPNGSVLQGAADVTLRLPHPKMAWELAEIEVHQHEDGRWMWAVGQSGGGYKVGPKWGRFAPTQLDAIRYGAAELLDWCDRNANQIDGMMIDRRQFDAIRAWAESLL